MASAAFLTIALLQGVGLRDDVPGVQYLVCQSGAQQSAGYGYLDLPDQLGRGDRVGLMVGAWIAQVFGGFSHAYLLGGVLTVISTLYFWLYVGPHFNRNKLR